MTENKRDVINKFLRCAGSKDKKATEQALENLQNFADSYGLQEKEMEQLVTVLSSNKLSSALAVKLLHSLIPEKTVSKDILKNLLSWYFSEVESGKLSRVLEKQFIDWVTGIVQFELGDVSIVESYLYSFLTLLKNPPLEFAVSKLLSLILKPEDAKRWTVKQILDIQKKSGSKQHINSLLSIMKSFKPEVVPENVPMARTDFRNTAFHDRFLKANERRVLAEDYNHESPVEITWKQFRCYDKKSAQLRRLIPTAEKINFEAGALYMKKAVSVMDIENMASLGTHSLNIDIPTQSLSLLSNIAGFHVLAFSDAITKSRFSYKLRHTLYRVFILELEPYSENEKSDFLNSLVDFEEYIHEGIPVVTEFLLHYLLIWDGDEFRSQIFSLIPWIVLQSSNDWEECLFRPLRQIFRSSRPDCKTELIDAMTSLLRNVIASLGRKEGIFFCEPNANNSVAVIADIAQFVSELVVEGIIWNTKEGRREIITAGLDFYEVCGIIEYSEDFPLVLTMPPALVYGCLYSASKICISRFCSLIIRFWQRVIEKVMEANVNERQSEEVEKTFIYLLDYYRFLWSSFDFEPNKESFIFRDKAFRELSWEFENVLNVDVKHILHIQNNYVFWDGNNSTEHFMGKIATEYPSIADLKHFCEDRLFQM